MKLYSIFVVLLLVFISTVQAQDECLDVAAAKYLVNNAAQMSFPDPDANSVPTTITELYNMLRADSSAYAINLYLGYDNGHFISVQNCYAMSALSCFYSPSGYFATVAGYGDQLQRYYAIAPNGTVDPNQPLPVPATSYNVTSRPFYNSNGWSASYAFANLDTTGRTYEYTQQSTGAHIASDRINTEPCAPPYGNSIAILAAQGLSSNEDLNVYGNATTTSEVTTFLNLLLSLFQLYQQSSLGIATLGLGFDNGNYYSVSDCNALPASGRVQECSSSRYYGEVRNQAIYGNGNLQDIAFDSTGAASSTARNSGTFFDTTSRPWFVTRNGYTDPYAFQTGSGTTTSRSYAASFNGGVVFADPNTQSAVVPTPTYSPVPTYSPIPSYSPMPTGCPTPTPSPSSSGCVASPSPSPCGGNNNNNDDSVTINFYFADILRQN